MSKFSGLLARCVNMVVPEGVMRRLRLPAFAARERYPWEKSEEEEKQLFNQWLAKHKKSYDSYVEYDYRFAVFTDSLRRKAMHDYFKEVAPYSEYHGVIINTSLSATTRAELDEIGERGKRMPPPNCKSKVTSIFVKQTPRSNRARRAREHHPMKRMQEEQK